jgi:hypothetical protein
MAFCAVIAAVGATVFAVRAVPPAGHYGGYARQTLHPRTGLESPHHDNLDRLPGREFWPEATCGAWHG